jgi:cathepsin B
MGFVPDSELRQKYKQAIANQVESLNTAIPDQFDSRTQWPTCVHKVLDQGDCGSCWAFGSTESLSDRFCISSNGTVNVMLSVEELVSCNDEGIEACRGGDPFTAYVYTSEWGLPIDSCFPYTAGDNGTVPPCRDSCVNQSQPYQPYYSQVSTIRWHATEEGIQSSVITEGPVVACFSVYRDFFSYSSGVYVYASGDYVGGHCVKIVGWGIDSKSGLNYWIVQNSWGTDWGLQGFFWIERGVDMCGIEREVFSVLPDLSTAKQLKR